MWARLVWWPMGKGLGAGSVGKVGKVGSCWASIRYIYSLNQRCSVESNSIENMTLVI